MRRSAAGAALLLTIAAPHARAQGVVDRTPNLDDGWTVPTGVIQFNFLHRFEVSPPPARKITSFPNFRLATGAPYGFNVALDYATNSTVFSGIPNEYQLALRRPILREAAGAPLDLGVTAGYAFAPQSVDAELSLARRVGRVRLLGAVRGMTNGYDVQRSLVGIGGGAVVRVTSWLSLAGDVFGIVNPPEGAELGTAWGAAAQLRIPYSPHTFSIQVTNTQSASIEGSSRGVSGAHMAGFEFTIPFTLSRYFGRRKQGAHGGAEPAEEVPAGEAAIVRAANLAFGPQTLRVRAGTRVRWVNEDQVQHTVTANDGEFDSGLIEPGQSWEREFAEPGEYPYHCTPHPFMTGRVIVER
jgi:plastocyanin